MADGIRSGVGEQLGQLGKQIVTDIAKVPAQITGFDGGKVNESVGLGKGGQQKGKQGQGQFQGLKREESFDPLAALKQKDNIEKQKQLAQARRLLQQFIEPSQQKEPSLREKLEMEELEKRKKEIEEEKKKAAALPQMVSKPKRGNLYGVKSKTHGSELGKNVKSQ